MKTIKINKDATANQTANVSKPVSPTLEKSDKNDGANKTVAKPAEPVKKKKAKKCIDVDEDEQPANQTKLPPAKVDESTSAPAEPVPVDPLADPAADSLLMPAAPAPPLASATKEQKLKYLDDLEKNLQRTKDQVKKEKEREEAKIKE